MSAKQLVARWAYTLSLLCLLPVLAGYLIWRGIRQPDYFKYWSERFLGLAVPRPAHEPADGPFENQSNCKVLWIHAVSVGETRACVPLIEKWLSQDPRHRVVLTHTTPTGRETGRALLSKWFESQGHQSCRIVQRYLPYDLPWSNAWFLNWAKPALGMLMETELWPNLLAQAHARNIPIVLANARLSLRSAEKLQAFRWLATPALSSLAGIAAQTPDDANRLAQAAGFSRRPEGSPRNDIEVTGNMKFDVDVPQSQLHLGQQWRAQLGSGKVFLAASTRDDEELEILKAWASVRQTGGLENRRLLIVPRHPQRFDRVARMIELQGFVPLRRSLDWQEIAQKAETHPDQSSAVLLGDSLGEMFAYLQLAEVVLIGGSIPALGGQNPIEACALGKPVFFGPHMFNFSQIAKALLESGAGAEVRTPLQWIGEAASLMRDPVEMEKRSQAARDFASAHRGATEKTLDFITAILSAGR